MNRPADGGWPAAKKMTVLITHLRSSSDCHSAHASSTRSVIYRCAMYRELLPCLSVQVAGAKSVALQMLQRLLDRLGMTVVPYLNLLVVPLMGLTSDSLPAVRAAATSAFAAAVALLPLAQVSHGRLTSVLTLIKQPRCLCSLRKHTAWVYCACEAERAVFAMCLFTSYLNASHLCRALRPREVWTRSRLLDGTRMLPS